VIGIHEVPPAFVARQIRAVLEDIGADAVKIGMLQNAGVIEAVADALDPDVPVVLDPVMVAKGGARLLAEEAVAALADRLVPRATVVTPNIPEAAALSGVAVRTVEDMEAAGRRILERGAGAVLVKGGHAEGDEVVDVLVESGSATRFRHARVHTRNTHGTGCTISSAVAALLARGAGLAAAVAEARAFVRQAMRAGPGIGTGHGPLDHLVLLRRDARRHDVLLALGAAFEALQGLDFAPLVPEVQSNLACALPGAEDPADVAAFPGRIVRVGRRIAAPAAPAFGASQHVARIVLTVMRYDPEHRACLNIRYGPDILARLEEAGCAVAAFDRRQEPPDVKAREGATLEWGTDVALREANRVPDAIADQGGAGKEPMIRLLGRTPGEIVEKLRRLLPSRPSI
jgi:hydroxymethylpyrimidine/phosphomethylpyrimidine kinase